MTPDRLHEIERVFQEARERPLPERAAWLAQIGRDDSDLAREVASLLAEPPKALLDASVDTLAERSIGPPAPRLGPGASLGSYRIDALIGTGGMGEVYRAHDTILGRDVAIKLLPAELRADPERLARFEREARLLATLNHPHVATIHGIVEADGVRGLVLELIEGPTLADELRANPLPIAEALRLARQIADGLDAIHSRGVVHRDLKPANIKISPRGIVKVIDFGIGKVSPDAGLATDAAITADNTTAGVVLGTPAYMSPEQASGGQVDKRTDIWAFGCVLFEMLSGGRAFPGDDARDALAGVLGGEPDWARLPALTPSPIRRLLGRCLEKDPARRLRDIGDALFDLDDALAPGRAPPARLGAWRTAGAVGAIGGLLAGILAAAVFWPRPAPRPAAAVQRLSLLLPASSARGGFALSPDGTMLVYEADRQLHLRTLDNPQPRPLPGTTDALNPFFSPDGGWIGFVSAPMGQGLLARRGQLRKTSVQGGTPVTLAGAVALGGSWGADDRIVFAGPTEQGVGLFSVAAAGGTPVPLGGPVPQGVRHGWPHHLPGGRTILFSETDAPTFDSARTVAWAPGWTETRRIVDVGSGARFVSSGHLVYLLDGDVMAVGFDPVAVRTTGTPVRVISGVEREPVSGSSSLTIAATGLLLYSPGEGASGPARSLVWVTRDGQSSDVLEDRAQYSYPRLSPDGRRLAVGTGFDIAIIDLVRGTRSRIAAEDRGTDPAPPITAWAPDGRRLAFNRRSPPVVRMEWVDPDALEAPSLLVSRPYLLALGSWSKSGTLVFFEIPGNTKRDLAVLEPSNPGEPTAWLSTRFNERGPVFSPDGRAVAYTSDASGVDQVYVRAYPGGGAAVQVSVDGGTEPVWSRDGRELFFRDGARMLSAAMTPAGLSPARPRVLFDRAYADSVLGVAAYDVGSDGRFIMIADRNPATTEMLAVVQHWFEELKRLVPAE